MQAKPTSVDRGARNTASHIERVKHWLSTNNGANIECRKGFAPTQQGQCTSLQGRSRDLQVRALKSKHSTVIYIDDLVERLCRLKRTVHSTCKRITTRLVTLKLANTQLISRYGVLIVASLIVLCNIVYFLACLYREKILSRLISRYELIKLLGHEDYCNS